MRKILSWFVSFLMLFSLTIPHAPAASLSSGSKGNGNSVTGTNELWKLSGTTLQPTKSTWTVSVGGASVISGSLGATDNRLLRTDGTGAKTAQGSAVTVDDSGSFNIPANQTISFNTSNAKITHSTDQISLYGGTTEAIRNVVSTSGAYLGLLPFNTSTGNTTVLRFYELTANGGNFRGFKAADAYTGDVTWLLPTTDTAGFFKSNGSAVMSIAAVDLASSDVTGNLGVSHLNSGTSASASTFWRGDGAWATPAGGAQWGDSITGSSGFGLTLTPTAGASGGLSIVNSTTGLNDSIQIGSSALSDAIRLGLDMTRNSYYLAQFRNTISGNTLGNNSTERFSVKDEVTNTKTSGTLTNDNPTAYFLRKATQNGAGGTFADAGQVVKIENNSTQTAGTLTDTNDVLQLVQDSASTGNFISGVTNGATLWSISNSGNVNIGTSLDSTVQYLKLDTLDNDTAGPPASGDCDAAIEVGRAVVATRYTAVAEYALYVCTKTGASTYAWKSIALL